MFKGRRAPQRVVNFIAEQFLAAYATFKTQRDLIVSYGISEYISADVLETWCHANSVNEVVKDRPAAANPSRVKWLTEALNRATGKMQGLEIHFLTSLCLSDMIQDRIDALPDAVYAEFWNVIDGSLDNWLSIREVRPINLSALRSAYCRVIGNLETAEAAARNFNSPEARKRRAEETVKLVLSPTPSTPAPKKNHKRSLADRERTQAMKGVNPPADKHGHGKRKERKVG